MQVSFGAQMGISRVARKMELLDIKQYLEMRKEAFSNDNVQPTTSNAVDLMVWDPSRNIDWQDRLIGSTARTGIYNIGLSGGSQDLQFQIGANYRTETTVFPGDFGYQQGAFNLSLNYAPIKSKFTASFTSHYITDKNNLFNFDLTQFALTTPPNAPEFVDTNGDLIFSNLTNPYALARRKFKAQTANMSNSGTLGYQIIPNLKVKVNLGYTRFQRDELQVNPRSTFNPTSTSPSYSFFRDGLFTSWNRLMNPNLLE